MAVGSGRVVRPHRRWLAGTVAVLAVAAGCSSSTGVPSVVVVGDSVTAVGQVQLNAALDPPYHPTYQVRYGGRVGQLSALLHSSIASSGTPGIVVTAVGTANALHPGAGAQTAAPVLAPLVAVTAGVPCVVLTTVNVRADRQGGSNLAARINRQVKALAVADPTKYKVVDWNQFLVTLPAPSVPTYLRPDGILETQAGARWLATADLSAVRDCGSARQPTVIGPNRG